MPKRKPEIDTATLDGTKTKKARDPILDKLYESTISELDETALGVLDNPTDQQVLDIIDTVSGSSEEQIAEFGIAESSSTGSTLVKDSLDKLLEKQTLEWNQAVLRVLDCADTQEALRMIDSLSKKRILGSDAAGLTVLHMLAWSNIIPTHLDMAQIVKALVAKNPEILNKKSNGYTPIEFAILQDNLEYLKILMPHYAGKESEVKILDWPKGIYVTSNNLDPKEKIKGDVINGEREVLSPQHFALRHGQFAMFEFLHKNDFGGIKVLKKLSKYKLKNPRKENLEELYKDLFAIGNKELLKELHRNLGYYEGHEGQDSPELIAALRAANGKETLKLISQGHYVYSPSFLEDHTWPTPITDFIFLNSINHPNFNINAKNHDSYTPFTWAAEKGETEAVKMLLKDPRIDVNAKNQEDYTPIELASRYGRTKVVKALLKHNADVNAEGKSGWTPIQLAASFRRTRVAKVLLKHNADVNAEGEYGWSPLHIAARDNYGTGVPELLLKDPRIDVNAKDKEGKTPLYFAAERNHRRVAKLLLKHNADVNAEDSEGKTPFHLAVENHHDEVVKLLLKHMDSKMFLDNIYRIPQDCLVASNQEMRELIMARFAKEKRKLEQQKRLLSTILSTVTPTTTAVETATSSTAMPTTTIETQVDSSAVLQSQNRKRGSESPEQNPSKRR